MDQESISAYKAEISRINGAKSKGPTTAEGKARSSQNAIKHGILSRAVILDGENQAEFDALLESLREDCKPEGCVEEFLVEKIALCQWRLRRLLNAETASISNNLINPFGIAGIDSDSGEQYLLDEKKINTIVRYETSLERQLYKAMEHLERLKSRRPKPFPNP